MTRVGRSVHPSCITSYVKDSPTGTPKCHKTDGGGRPVNAPRKAPADVARNLQAIERLKADAASGVAALFEGMYRNDDEQIEDALATIVVSAFALSKRLGISYAGLDDAIRRRLSIMIEQSHEAEQWFGDCSELLQYMRQGAG